MTRPARSTLFGRLSRIWCSVFRSMPELDATGTMLKPVGKLKTLLWGRMRVGVRIPKELQIRETQFVPRAAKRDAKSAAIYALLPRIPFSLDDLIVRTVRKTPGSSSDPYKIDVIAIPKSELIKLYRTFQSSGYEVDYFIPSNPAGDVDPRTKIMPRALKMKGLVEERYLRHAAIIGFFLAISGSLYLASDQIDTSAGLQERYNKSLSGLIMQSNARQENANQLRSSNSKIDQLLNRKSDLARHLFQLSTLLGNKSWLERVSYEKDGLTIAGLSDEPARILEAINKQIPGARAEFIGPLVADPKTGQERFVIRMFFKASQSRKTAQVRRG